ncbi:hypothetical protein C3747_7g467 [Trypanosoma cruzi]|uniref:Uncharacterized protein n=2 Tax=Trypanosoma cruzi TaxID=5693 RepID=Q4D0P9_TRYCC|nr:hypothetical protein, conserved [Trypanosoma cruzi]EAN86098.1 hypothetical protein, conserved [Trypanosoma cruzi]PWV20108.1 hypothetical protein C3747_7g467 [Trypanosoma cruzi]|eukprot:XP_807949.1 hypothetical protein [Trypanosoma cruzi strain CL Brener]
MVEKDPSRRPSPRLTAEQLQDQIRRLTYRPPPPVVRDPFPVCPSVKRSKDEIDAVTQRVFYEQCQRHERALIEAREKWEKEWGLLSKEVPSEYVEDMVKRLYYDTIERIHASRKSAEERLLFKSNKKVPVVPLKKFVEDMYLKGMQRERDKEKKLYEKYILPTEIKRTLISREDAEASGTRLSARTGAN